MSLAEFYALAGLDQIIQLRSEPPCLSQSNYKAFYVGLTLLNENTPNMQVETKNIFV